jgi:hypothetical protein
MRKMLFVIRFALQNVAVRPEILGCRETYRVCDRMHARLLGTCFEFKTQKERQVGTALKETPGDKASD